jgi:hypothetical protein
VLGHGLKNQNNTGLENQSKPFDKLIKLTDKTVLL